MAGILDALRGAGSGGGRTGHLEKWLSLCGGLAGMWGVLTISQATLGLGGSAGLVASMGASAVLLFAVPHGPLSQPWPLVGGHVVSAVIGVAIAKTIAQPVTAATLAVALAIGAMHYLRCIHPPGGATALTAVAGGDAVHSLGYSFVMTPVLLNALTILVAAILFNALFPWRRYPARWARALTARHASRAARPVAIDDPDDNGAPVMRDLSQGNAGTPPALGNVRVGACYCNGEFGPRWQVRQIIRWEEPGDGDDAIVIYAVVAGEGRRGIGSAPRAAFLSWASYEVFLNENSWQRVAALPEYVVTEDAA